MDGFNELAAQADASAAQQREDMRRQTFKPAIDASDSRRKREEVQIKIRKQKKKERLAKRRMNARRAPSSVMPAAVSAGLPGTREEHIAKIPQLVVGVNSADPATQLLCTSQFRKMLSIENQPPIAQVIKSGVVPRLVQFLRQDNLPRLQFEAAWALTNIASGTSSDTHFVVDNGAVPFFVYLLKSPNDDVREQAVWALGNIAGDSCALRDMVLKNNALPPLIRQLQLECKLGMMRNATWLLSNLCRGKPAPDFPLVAPALETMARLIFSVDEEVLTDACWALSYLSDGLNDQIQAVIQAGVCTRLIELLNHPSPAVQTPALRTVGNIVTGDDLQTQVVINLGALNALADLLRSPRKGIRKEACWTISNITAGSPAQIEAVLKADIIPPLVQRLQSDEWDIQKEAAWAVSNATSGGTNAQVDQLVKQGCIPALVGLLGSKDPKVVTVAMEGLENILKVGEVIKEARGLESNGYHDAVEACMGIEALEYLWNHPETDIYYKSLRLLRKYFNGTDEADPQLETSVGADGLANFGVDMDADDYHFDSVTDA